MGESIFAYVPLLSPKGEIALPQELQARQAFETLAPQLQAANAAVRIKDSYLRAQHQRLAGRRGRKRIIVAVAHSILVIAYHLISRKEPYQDLGGNYFDNRRPEATVKRLIKRLESLGVQVAVQVPLAPAIA